MARCSNGHEAAAGTAGTKFCMICGAPMMVTCPNGHEVKAAAHCTVCGVPLSAATTAATKEAPASDAERPEFSDTDTTVRATSPPPDAADEHPSRRSWLIIGSVALLVLLVGGGAYFGVTMLTGSSNTKPTQATQPSPIVQPSPVGPSTITTPAPAPTATTAPTSPSAVPPQTTTVQPAPPASPASAVVEEYFADINAGDYAGAWSLGGKNLQGGSYDSFVAGFATTAFDSVTIVSTTGDTVQMRLDALQTDGSHRYFAGTYTVRDGVIASADVQQTSG